MRTSLGCASAFVLLAACSDGTTTPGSGGSTSTASTASTTTSGTGGGCNACGAVVEQALPRPSLCNGTSATLYENLQSCACAGGPCGTLCDKEVCATAVPSSACLSCLQSSCASTWTPCTADASH